MADAGTAPITLSVVLGGRHTCALVGTGDVRCWGSGELGRLGYGDTNNIGDGLGPLPKDAGDVPLGDDAIVTEVAAGLSHTCVLLDTARVRCWGNGDDGRLGYGDVANVGDAPSRLPSSAGDVPLGDGAVVVEIAAGGAHTCALLDTGKVRCWGANTAGQLGYGHTASVGAGEGEFPLPEDAGDVPLGDGAVARRIAAGSAHTCVVLDGGRVRCWGSNVSGQLGYGDVSTVGAGEGEFPLPEDAGDVPLGDVVVDLIAAGGSHTCALLGTGGIMCWGSGDHGQLGYGHTESVGGGDGDFPLAGDGGQVPVGERAIEIAAGLQHSCARLDTGNVRCWGSGGAGQLGYGDTDDVGDRPENVPSAAGDVPIGHRVAEIAAGHSGIHTCARLNADGVRLRCWGNNATGQLGYGHTDNLGDDPGTVPEELEDVPLFSGP